MPPRPQLPSAVRGRGMQKCRPSDAMCDTRTLMWTGSSAARSASEPSSLPQQRQRSSHSQSHWGSSPQQVSQSVARKSHGTGVAAAVRTGRLSSDLHWTQGACIVHSSYIDISATKWCSSLRVG